MENDAKILEYLQGVLEGHKQTESLYFKLQQRERWMRVALQQQIEAMRAGEAWSAPGEPPRVPSPPPYPLPPCGYHRGTGYHQNPPSEAIWAVVREPP